MDKFVPLSSSIISGMISLSVPDAMLIALGIFIALRIFVWKRMDGARTVLCALFAAYLGALVSLTLFPMTLSTLTFDPKRFSEQLIYANLKPFDRSLLMIHNGLSADNMKTVFYNLGGNFIMLMPLGIFIPMIKRRLKPYQSALMVTGAAFCVEFLQYIENAMVIGHNDVSIDDFLLNAAGGVLVCFIFTGLRSMTRKRRGSRRRKL